MCLGVVFSMLPKGIGRADAVTGGGVGLAIFMPFYMLRILGAGDVKLLAVVGLYVGYPGVLRVALFSGLAGGLLAVGMAQRYGNLMPMLRHLYQDVLSFFVQVGSGNRLGPWVTVSGPPNLPYALAIAFGTLAYLFLYASIFD